MRLLDRPLDRLLPPLALRVHHPASQALSGRERCQRRAGHGVDGIAAASRSIIANRWTVRSTASIDRPCASFPANFFAADLRLGHRQRFLAPATGSARGSQWSVPIGGIARSRRPRTVETSDGHTRHSNRNVQRRLNASQLAATSVGGLGTNIGDDFGNVGLGGECAADGVWMYFAATVDLTPAGASGDGNQHIPVGSTLQIIAIGRNSSAAAAAC